MILCLSTCRGAGNKIGLAGAKSLAAAFFHSPLVSIDISFNELGSEGMSLIAHSFPFQTRMTALNVQGNTIGVAGARNLASGLRTLSCLRALDVADNCLSSAGLEALCQCLSSNIGLASLNLCNNPIVSGEEIGGQDDRHAGLAK